MTMQWPKRTNLTPLADIAIAASTANAPTLLRRADETRIALVVTNNDATLNARIGDATTTATKGVRLSAGASITVTATSDIYAISEGAALTLSLSEETLN